MKLTDEQLSIMDTTIGLKIHEFRKSNIKTITKDIYKEFLYKNLWEYNEKIDTFQLVDDILNVASSDILDFLSRKAIVEAVSLNFDDFKELFK